MKRNHCSRAATALALLFLIVRPTPVRAQDPQLFLSFSPQEGYAGNSCYDAVVQNGNSISVDLIYRIEYFSGGSSADLAATIRTDAAGRWHNCTVHDNQTGVYRFTQIKAGTSAIWSATNVTYTLPAPQPSSFRAQTTVTAGDDPALNAYSVDVGNGGNLTLDVKYTYGGAEQVIWGWPSLDGAGHVSIWAGPCTPSGTYVYTGAKNTLNAAWVGVSAPVTVSPPTQLPVVNTVVPNYVVRGAGSRDLAVSGTNLCPATIGTAWPGLSAANISGTMEARSVQVRATATPTATAGIAPVTLSGYSGSTSFNVVVYGPPIVTSVTPNSGSRGNSLAVTIAGTSLCPGTLSTSWNGLSVTTTGCNATGNKVDARITIAPGADPGTASIALAGLAGSTTFPFTVHYNDTKEYIYAGSRLIAIETAPNVAVPAGPVGLAPSAGAAGIGLTPTLSWSASSGAASYDVYLGRETPPPFVRNVSGTSYVHPEALARNTVYYWRVEAKNSAGSGSSATQTFTTVATTAPPEVTTGSATDIGQGGATLRASVNPKGLATSVKFQWGTSTAYGNTTGSQSIESGSTPVVVTIPLSGLSVNQTYHYRAVATSIAGTTNGADQAFGIYVPSASTLAATGVTAGGATVNGSVNPNGLATTVTFQWGTSSAYGNTTSAQSIGNGAAAVNVAAVLSGLSAGQTYHYRVIATNNAGTTNGADLIFVSGTPSAVTLSATGITAGGATLNGVVNPNGATTSVFFQWGATTSYGNTTDSQSLGSGTTALPVNAAIAGLSVGLTYHYRVVAISIAGQVYGTDQTLVILTPTATTLAASDVTASSARLNGSVDPRGLPAAVQFDWGMSTSYGNTTGSQSVGTVASVVAADLTGLMPGQSYHFRVVATSAAGTTRGGDLTFTTPDTGKAVMLSPTPGTTLSTAAVTFTWSKGGGTQYMFWIGRSVGAYDVYYVNTGTSITAAPAGLPVDGNSLYIRLWTFLNGAWVYNDYVYQTLNNTPPSASTSVATGISSDGSSATLTGYVNPNGLATSVVFQWGASTAYGNTSSMQSIGAGRSQVRVFTALTGLTPNRTYHFRVMATSSAGTSYGADNILDTGVVAELTAPTSGTVINSLTATFSWTQGGGIYCLYVGRSQGGGEFYSANVGANRTAVVTLSALDSNPIYVSLATYLSARGGWNFRYYSFQTNQKAVMLSPAPSSTLSSTTATFSWTQGGGSQHLLYVGTSPGTANLFSTNTASLTATVTSLPTDGSTIYVRLGTLVAFSDGEGGYYHTWIYTDYTYSTLNTIPPSVSTGAAAVGADGKSATLNGYVNPNGLATTVAFQWGTTTSYGNTTGNQSIGNGRSQVNSSAALTGLTPNQIYHYRVMATSSAGVSYGADATFNTGVAAELLSPAPGSTLNGLLVTFTWTKGGGSQYFLYVGTCYGCSDVYWTSTTNQNVTATLDGLPNPLSVMLATYVNGRGWLYKYYSFFTNSKAIMLSPAPGTVLTSPTATFSWSQGAGIQYSIAIGQVPGGSEVYYANTSTLRTAEVSGLPLGGKPLYVRLSTLIPVEDGEGGYYHNWFYNDYTYPTQ